MKNKKSMFSIWKRLLSYIVGHHKLVFGAVLVCILISFLYRCCQFSVSGNTY